MQDNLSKPKKEEHLLSLSQYLVGFCREFAPVVLKIPRVYASGEYITKTDGRVVKVGDKFFSQSVHQQLFKLLQVSMHVALRHNNRAREIQHNPVAIKVWNMSTDLVINNAIKDYIKAKLDRGEESLESEFQLKVLNMLTSSIPDFNLDELNAEQVFEKILRFIDAQQSNPNSDSSSSTMQKLEQELDNYENEFSSNKFEDTSKILEEAGLDSEDQENSETNNLIWSKRVDDLISKLVGTEHSNSILKLKKELPKVKVDWTRVLRDFLTSRLLQEREPNWKRPGRRYTAGISEYFEPYRDRKKGIKKLVVCWDISGSCFDDNTVAKFVANIEAVHSITACQLYLVPFDTEVVTDEVVQLHHHQKLSDLIKESNLNLSGGGGTSFIPPIEYSEKLSPDVIVVLTDCYGPFPDPIRVPVLWASTGDTAPWGKTININD